MQPSSDCGVTPWIASQGDSIRSKGPASSRLVPESNRLLARSRALSSMKLRRRRYSRESTGADFAPSPPLAMSARADELGPASEWDLWDSWDLCVLTHFAPSPSLATSAKFVMAHLPPPLVVVAGTQRRAWLRRR